MGLAQRRCTLATNRGAENDSFCTGFAGSKGASSQSKPRMGIILARFGHSPAIGVAVEARTRSESTTKLANSNYRVQAVGNDTVVAASSGRLCAGMCPRRTAHGEQGCACVSQSQCVCVWSSGRAWTEEFIRLKAPQFSAFAAKSDAPAGRVSHAREVQRLGWHFYPSLRSAPCLNSTSMHSCLWQFCR